MPADNTRYPEVRKNLTIYADASLRPRLRKLAATYGVTQADLANFLLLHVVSMAERGELQIKTKVARRQIVM